jgi:asparagine synthase (glutamine-hydrolysing)
VPFLDHHFLEFAMSIPDRPKIRRGTQKYVLKRAVEDLLPRTESPARALRAPDGLLAAYADLGEIDSLLERHRGGLVDATDRIWRLLNLQIWGDVFLNGGRERWQGLVGGRAAAHSAV